MVLFQKSGQRVHVQGVAIVCGVKHRLSAVDAHEIREALSEDAIVQDQHPVARFSQAGAGGFQAKDSLAIQNQSLIPGVQKRADELAGFFIESKKIRVQVGIGAG